MNRKVDRSKGPQLAKVEREMELEEIAVELGVSRQRVQQILAVAMAKVRFALKRRGITCADQVFGTMMVKD